jgi:FKBP-type peptidyl-prolyl cis-trans isomerase
MKIKLFVFLLMATALISCGPTYEGYTDLDSKHFKKLLVLGNEKGGAMISSYYGMLVSLNPDSSFTAQTYLLVHPEELHNYFASEVILKQINEMKEGEISRFILPSLEISQLFDTLKNSSVERFSSVEVKLEKRFSDNDNICGYYMHQAQEAMIPELDAIKLCQSTLDKEWEDFGQISMAWIRKTEGDSVKAGREISIEYNTYWLNGVRKDSLTTMTIPFGKPGQLIPGLQYGLSLMKDGERALIYMPSALAFGEEGSRTGIIPPRTPIYFDVNVTSVKKPS